MSDVNKDLKEVLGIIETQARRDLEEDYTKEEMIGFRDALYELTDQVLTLMEKNLEEEKKRNKAMLDLKRKISAGISEWKKQ